MAPLTSGRVTIAVSAIYQAKVGLATAIRYALTRRAFSLTPDQPELLLLDYPSHQHRLLPLLAKTWVLHSCLSQTLSRSSNDHITATDHWYSLSSCFLILSNNFCVHHLKLQQVDECVCCRYAMSFAAVDLKKLYVKRRPEDSKVIHVLSSGLKAIFSWHNMHTLQVGLSLLLSICFLASLCTFVMTLVFWEVAIQFNPRPSLLCKQGCFWRIFWRLVNITMISFFDCLWSEGLGHLFHFCTQSCVPMRAPNDRCFSGYLWWHWWGVFLERFFWWWVNMKYVIFLWFLIYYGVKVRDIHSISGHEVVSWQLLQNFHGVGRNVERHVEARAWRPITELVSWKQNMMCSWHLKETITYSCNRF